jgi:hypothetical protein
MMIFHSRIYFQMRILPNTTYFVLFYCQPAAQHRLQLTPLARPQTWCVFDAYRVPLAMPSMKVASGAIEA